MTAARRHAGGVATAKLAKAVMATTKKLEEYMAFRYITSEVQMLARGKTVRD
jgi:hypothetical protein